MMVSTHSKGRNGILLKEKLVLLLFLLPGMVIHGQKFEDYFVNNTLRIDYVFSGTAFAESIALDELSETGTWAGRRYHLDSLPLAGNGQITMRDAKTGRVIYKTSFSSLFQEWVETDEAKLLARSFQNTFLVPFPKEDSEIEIVLLNNKQQVMAHLKHLVKPTDILIHKKGKKGVFAHKYLLKNGPTEDCIDIAILGEGYTATENDLLYKDAETAMSSIFIHEPFKSMKSRFNIVLAESPSADSGVSTPRLNDWKETTFGSHFDTFYSDRYLTTNQTRKIHDVLAGIPYEHIIILANSNIYGGGGIYNGFTLTSTHHKFYAPVVVHEFGHSFGGLADEYFYENDTMTDSYDLKTEPWEQNVTTLVNFRSKWKDMIPASTPIPTPTTGRDKFAIGVYQGAAYSAKGIYRGSDDCRMRTNTAEAFCPVCQRALERLIRFYTEK